MYEEDKWQRQVTGDHAIKLILIASEFHAACRPQVGHVGSETTRSADARLGARSRQTALACTALGRVSMTRALVSFCWRSRTDQIVLQGVEMFLHSDTRLDLDLLQVCRAIPLAPGGTTEFHLLANAQNAAEKVG